MTDVIANKPICKTVNCKQELTFLEEQGCWRCLVCNPLPKKNSVPPPEKKKYLDVAMTESMVREIVRDELENWHIQRPPVTKEGVVEMLDATDYPGTEWRRQAKQLNIPLCTETGGGREKEDVLRDIEARTTEAEANKEILLKKELMMLKRKFWSIVRR